jgi:hypothetical protein
MVPRQRSSRQYQHALTRVWGRREDVSKWVHDVVVLLILLQLAMLIFG